MLIAYSFTHLARMYLYFLSSFASIVLGRRHSGTDSAHWGINLINLHALSNPKRYFRLPNLPASDTPILACIVMLL
jgi:hypothetical protein